MAGFLTGASVEGVIVVVVVVVVVVVEEVVVVVVGGSLGAHESLTPNTARSVMAVAVPCTHSVSA